MKPILLFTISLLSVVYPAFAETNQDSGQEQEKIKIRNIEFQYTMMEANGQPHCEGSLSYEVYIPSNAISVAHSFTSRCQTEYTGQYFLNNTIFPFEETECWKPLHLKLCYWGVFFRAKVLVGNEESRKLVYSDIYCTTDFMSPEDREAVLSQSGISDLESPADDFRVLVDDGRLIISSDCSQTNVTVHDIYGRLLLSDSFSGNYESPEPIPASGIIIVNIQSPSSSKSLKLKL